MNYRRTLPFASAILVVQAQAPAPPPTALAAPAAATSASQAAPVTGAQAGAGEGVQRSIRTINYRLIKSTTRIDLQNATGTAGVEGRAKIKCKGGITLIKAKFTGLPVPSAFGRANLTYVLWAVSPEGRAVSLGELQVKHGRAKVAGVLASHQALRIQVEGFTDSTGTAQVNQRLSEERALALMEEERETHFDPTLWGVFLTLVPELRRIAAENPDESVPDYARTLPALAASPLGGTFCPVGIPP